MATVAVLVKTVLPPSVLLSICPPLQVNGPVKTTVLVPSNVPAASSKLELIVCGAAMFSVLPLTRCNPAPMKPQLPASVCVPPPNWSTQPGLAL